MSSLYSILVVTIVISLHRIYRHPTATGVSVVIHLYCKSLRPTTDTAAKNGERCFYRHLSSSLALWRHAEHDAEVALGIAGAADAEAADLTGVLDMCSQARAYVIVAYVDEA